MLTMETEFEAKFYPVDKKKTRNKLRDIGAKLLTPERKMRRAIVDRRVNKQLRCDYIRVRDEGDRIRISAKIHADVGGKVSDQKEVDLLVNDYDKAIQVIKAMGFEFDKYQETLRETWELDGAEVEIDTWPGLESYVEIEANSEKKVKDIALKLGFDWRKKRITSVVVIYMEM